MFKQLEFPCNDLVANEINLHTKSILMGECLFRDKQKKEKIIVKRKYFFLPASRDITFSTFSLFVCFYWLIINFLLKYWLLLLVSIYVF